MKRLTTDELQSIRDTERDIALIHVQPEEKYRQAHIPGSENIPVQSDDFVRKVEQTVGRKDKKVVVYAESAEANESPVAARKLEEAGFSRVYGFEGGTQAWMKARLPFETGPIV